MRGRLFAFATLLVLAGCARQAVFHDDDPPLLSDWSLMSRDGGTLRLHDGVAPYQLNATLFTDYAHKLRTITVPAGSKAVASPDGTIEFPVGTVISKTFFYPRDEGVALRVADHAQYVGAAGELDLARVRLVETRLLVRRTGGWSALAYVWNKAQTDAGLKVTGDVQMMTLRHENRAADFAYIVPDRNQCAGCHVTNTKTKSLSPIGPRLDNLNRDAVDGGDQLASAWLDLSVPRDRVARLADWSDDAEDLDARARAYLDVNCGHCHSETGPADTSGLFLDVAAVDPVHLGICKLPIAAGQGTGGNRYSIVPGEPESSIMVYRMASRDPGAMMPELGRSLVHEEGVELVSAWIRALEGACEPWLTFHDGDVRLQYRPMQ